MTTIVVGVDGSESSRETLRFALAEARRWRATLQVVHAFWEYDEIPGTSRIEVERSQREREEWLDGFVREVVGEVRACEIAQSVVDADPAGALLSAARNAGLLIVGSHGHNGVTELVLGSVARQCAHRATCPVVVVRERLGRCFVANAHTDH